MDELLSELRENVKQYRQAKKAYNDFYDIHKMKWNEHGTEFSTSEEMRREVVFRTRVCQCERAIHDTALRIADKE